MAKYAISPEGVEALEQLAENLLSSAGDLLDANTRLSNAILSYSEDLGIYGDSILAIVRESRTALRENKDAIVTLAKTVAEKAKEVADLLCFCEGSPSGADKISAGNPMLMGNPMPAGAGNGFAGLPKTQQKTESVLLNGKQVTVFDHPFSEQHNRIYNQGSGFPTGPQQTCGCCASGTIMNKTGAGTDERNVVDYAWQNGLCSVEGFTSADNWIGILDGMAGIPAENTTGKSLEQLAGEVEQGKGVIIGVSACTYDSAHYGRYNPFKPDGHALVLDSVIRDAKTGEILEYVVVDSNGKSKADACRRVPKDILEKAYKRMQSQSVTTKVIIW